ncbi:MAG: outer membrane beta-barrel protein, partial [Bacteroidota bacterium]
MRSYTISFLCLFFFFYDIQAQSDSAKVFQYQVYVEAFYAYDFNNPVGNTRPENIFFNHSRHNEFNVNLALLELDYHPEKYRLHLGLMGGTYPEVNGAAEPTLLRLIYEAYAGIKIVNGLWLDAGVFLSNIGLETPKTIDNYTLTRSLGAETSPYYLSGIRLSYQPNEKWNLNAILSNGWQNIRENNDNKALSLQINFKPNAHWEFNSSSFYGKEGPNEALATRLYHNFYMQFLPEGKLSGVLGFDWGAQERRNEEGWDNWLTPYAILKYQFSPKFSLAARYEYFEDPGEIQIASPDPAHGFQTHTYSLNLNFQPLPNTLLSLEGRHFISDFQAFLVDPDLNLLEKQSFSLTG